MPPIPYSKDISLTSGLGPSASEYYSYAPLPTATSIRVLEWPKDVVPTADLRCKLRIIDLEDPKRPPYYCISYTWGAADGIDAEDAESMQSLFTNTIVCEDQLLRITENAHSALAELRWRGQANLYWLDATVVWLRESDGTTSTFYDEHCDIYHKREWSDYEQSRWSELSRGQGLTEFLALIPLPAQLVHAERVQAFFARNWFQRLWVIQEVVLAKNLWILCGSFMFNWQELVKPTNQYARRIALLGRSDATERALRGLDTLRLICALRGESYGFKSLAATALGPPSRLEDYYSTLIILIQTLVPSSATDARDRFYAPMALANYLCNPDPGLNFTPDYSKTAETTFHDAAVFMLRQMAVPSFISLCKPRNPNKARSLPSWVPDLRDISAQKPLSLLTDCNATASWDGFSNSVDHHISGIHLTVHGRGFGTIANVLSSDTNLADMDVLNLLSFASETRSSRSRRRRLSSTGCSTAHASPEYSLWETLTANRHITSSSERREHRRESDQLELGPFSLWLRFKVLLDLYRGVLSIEDMRRLLKKAIAREAELTESLLRAEERSPHHGRHHSIYRSKLNHLEFYLEMIEDLFPQQLSFEDLALLNQRLNIFWQYIRWEDLWLNPSEP
ncbi:hypothetical protein PV04_10315 [Phialophora macrospora]|uniref:Uncharacterized protein n=1 Tax=Phialophora macrospora TaxID=1851006 RepID=A0A0D2F6D9_9EURO|nr:hypothetical protein PV04_10315 [Phialophora macrospora]